MKTIRMGVIGTGSIADNCHAPVIRAVEGANLVSVLSRSEETAKSFLTRHNAVDSRIHTSIDSFANDPNIDCVIVASPDRLHAQQALLCLKAGKDVLLEKPMATSVDEAESLLHAAKNNKCILGVGFHLRFHNGHRSLFSSIKNEKSIGALRHIRALWAFPQKDATNWRAGHELGKWWSLAAVGSHCLDLVRCVADDMDEWASFNATIGRQVWNGPHDETAVISAQLASGPTVEMVSSVQFGPVSRLEIYGDKGQAVCDDTFGRKGSGTISINGHPLSFEEESPFIGQLQRFLDCVKTRTQPEADATVGLRSVKDLLLAHDA